MHSVYLNCLLQLMEALICFSFYEDIADIKNKKWKRLITIMLGYVIMTWFNLHFDYNVLVNNTLMILFHFLFCCFLYNQKKGFSLFCSLIVSSFNMISEIGAISIVSAILNIKSREFLNNPIQYLLIILLSKSLLFLFLKITGIVINRFKSNTIVNRSVIWYPVSLIFVMCVFSIITFNYNLSDWIKVLITVSSVLSMLCAIFICIFQQQSAQREKELAELKAVQHREEIERTYFDILEQQNEELQIFVHDTKKHLNNLYAYADKSDQARKYIKSLSDEIDSVNKIGKTSNKMLDLIINKYDMICKKNNIEFDKDIHTQISFIEDVDLTSIFNNLLDNAVDAVRLCENIRHIRLGVNRTSDFIVVNVTNSCEKPPVIKANKLVSTKGDFGLHGVGLKSVYRAIEKYNGQFEWDYSAEENRFSATVLFPCNLVDNN